MFNVAQLIQTFGLLVIGGFVFAESGLLVGFFLPGDTLLFTAGFFASQGKLSLPITILVIVVAAIAGDNLGFTIGKKAGPKIFKKKDGLLFRQDYLVQSEKFYEKHGGKTVLFARFVPIVRTFAPIVAGASGMTRRRFISYDILGALFWGGGITLAGFYLGSRIPNVDHYILPAVAIATIFTLGSPVLHLLRDKKFRQKIRQKISKSADADNE
ncbi:MAG: VTT domain-containing protein [Candidatus Saccharimonadales bacterium]